MKASKILDELVEELHRSFEKLPEHRTGENTQYEIEDAALSAFGNFFTQSRYFLTYQRMLEERKGKSNVSSLFRVERIPSDNQIGRLFRLPGCGPLPLSCLAIRRRYTRDDNLSIAITTVFRSHSLFACVSQVKFRIADCWEILRSFQIW